MADELKRQFHIPGCCPPVLMSQKMRHSLPSDPLPYCGDNWKLRNSTPNMPGHKHVSLTGAKPPWQKPDVVFGSPSYPSPLDRICTGKRDRAAQMGLALAQEASFEVNQSFPKASRAKLCLDEIRDVPNGKKVGKKNIWNIGDGLNDVSYSAGYSKGSFSMPSDHGSNQSMNDSGWSFYNYVGGGSTGMVFPTSIQNPNKAICTVNAKTSKILIANDMACELFGYDESELIGMNLKELLQLKSKDQLIAGESHLENTGEIVEVSGKVVDALDSTGIVLPVSLWVKKLECEREKCCLVVMEPVDRNTATFKFNGQGIILSCDSQLATLHGYLLAEDVVGMAIEQLIPAFNVPVSGKNITKNVKKQSLTGITIDGARFPLSVSIKLVKDFEDAGDDTAIKDVYQATVWVFSNISGLITFLPDGSIHSINSNLACLLFGYRKDDLIGKDISVLIPDFYDILNIEEEVVPFSNGNTGDVKLDASKGSKNGEGSDDQGIGSSITSSQNQGTKLDIHFDGLVTPPEITSTSTPNKGRLVDGSSSVKKFLSRTQISSTSSADQCSPIIPINGTNKFVDSQQSNTPITFSEELSPALVSTDARSVSPNSSASTHSDDKPLSVGDEKERKACLQPLDDADEFPLPGNVPNDSIISHSDGSEDECSDDEYYEDCSSDSVLSCEEKLELNTTADLLAAKLHTVHVHSSDSCGETSPLETSFGKSDNSDIIDALNKHEDENNLPNYDSAKHFSSNNNSISKSHPGEYENSSDEERGELLSQNITSKKKENTSTVLTNSSLQYQDSSSRMHYFRSLYDDLSDDEGPSLHDKSRLERTYDSGSDKENSNPSFGSSYIDTSASHSNNTTDYQSETGLYIPEGSYTGQCVHKDKSTLGIVFQIKRVQQLDGSYVYCMWVSRDPEEPGEGGRSYANLTMASTLNSSCADISNLSLSATNMSLGEMLAGKAQSDSKIIEEVDSQPVEPQCNSPSRGPYSAKYETLQSIGKGAFGFVKLAKKKNDKKEVVVKFIRKSKVLTNCWKDDVVHGTIPLEVSLLLRLSHTNIVSVLDVFQNDEFVQMVMEKHGGGMDLFEFIDRCPKMDEALTSYIYRQMVSAVSYLHSKNIMHRDIKDENIILNENFHIKLIDFGAASFMQPGQLFSTFCGTLEYCSPEVLLGNKYRGPELESWSLGVTLYTLVFGENPFFDVDETIRCVLKPPFQVSRSLMFLLLWILHPDPEKRATIADMERNNWVQQPIHIADYEWSDILPNSDFHGNIASDHRRTTPEGDEDDKKPRGPISYTNKTELQRRLIFAEMKNQLDDYVS